MRPITKILLLIVVAFVVYLVWPRTPDLKTFDPAALAKLQVEEWLAERDGKGMAALMARFQIYTAQFHFSPVAAFQMARNSGAGRDEIKAMRGQPADAVDERKAFTALTEKYAVMKRQLGAKFEPDVQAREEIAWQTLLLDGAETNLVANPIAGILAAQYGGSPTDFMDVAVNLASAQGMILSPNAPTDAGSPRAEAEQVAREAFTLLKEIAATPVDGPTPEGVICRSKENLNNESLGNFVRRLRRFSQRDSGGVLFSDLRKSAQSAD